MSYLVISCSLNPNSKSRLLAQRACALLSEKGVEAQFVDLQDKGLPPCDGAACYGDPRVQELGRTIRDADGVLLAMPIYNYSPSASVVNLVELTGNVWTEKVVGFLCAAGGSHSYMSVMSLANSLMLDFRSTIIPRFVYGEETHFGEDSVVSPHVEERMDELVATLIRFGTAMGQAKNE